MFQHWNIFQHWNLRQYWRFLKVGVKMGPYVPAQCAKTARGMLQIERLRILHRIYYFEPEEAETNPSDSNRSCVPHAGGQDDGSLHKLAQITFRALGKLVQNAGNGPRALLSTS